MKELTISVREVTLLVEQYCQRHMWPFAEIPTVRIELDKEILAYTLTAIQRVLVQRETIAEYPASWWDAVKERFAPGWFVKHWPVLRNRVDMTVLYPRISLPDQKHTVTVRVVKPSDWLHSYTPRPRGS